MKIDVERAAILWAEGLSIKDMAIYFDVAPRSMANLIHRTRVKFPYRGEEGKEQTHVPDAEELLDMLRTRSLKDIAEQYGVTRNVIDGRIRRYHERARINGTTMKARPTATAEPVAVQQKTVPADRVVRKTSGGAFVTLQRIPCIDG